MMKSPLLSRRQMLQGVAATGAVLGSSLLWPQSLLAAPRVEAQLHTETRIMLGTFVSVTLAAASRTQAQEATGQAFTRAAQLEGIFSRHQGNTPLSVLNAQGSLLDAPAELTALLSRAGRVHSLTSGAFDVSVAPVLDYYRSRSNPQGRIRLDARELAEARQLVSAKDICLAPDHVRLARAGMKLTLDGIAKGHIADVMGEVLAAHGVHNYLVNAGGDIRAEGQKAPGTPWRVAVQGASTLPAIALQGAIATSGSYEVYYDAAREHHHLIDPVAKASPRHTLSVSVTAPTALEADALATALSVLPTGDALRLVRSLPGRQCCLMARDGRVVCSEGWGRA